MYMTNLNFYIVFNQHYINIYTITQNTAAESLEHPQLAATNFLRNTDECATLDWPQNYQLFIVADAAALRRDQNLNVKTSGEKCNALPRPCQKNLTMVPTVIIIQKSSFSHNATTTSTNCKTTARTPPNCHNLVCVALNSLLKSSNNNYTILIKLHETHLYSINY